MWNWRASTSVRATGTTPSATCKLAYEIDPNNAEVHEAFALVYQSTGEFELAEESFKTAIRLDRKFSRARNNYAAFLYSQQRYEEAEKQLEYVVQDTLYKARPARFRQPGAVPASSCLNRRAQRRRFGVR